MEFSDFLELIAICIVNGYEEDEDEEPAPWRTAINIAMAQDKMEKCTFDSDEEMWEKARQFAIDMLFNNLSLDKKRNFLIDVIGFSVEDMNNMSKEDTNNYIINRGYTYECLEFNF